MEETSPHKSRSGIVRIWRALFYSIDGLKTAYRSEYAFKQELLLAVVLVPLAIVLPMPVIHTALMIASVLAVLVVELLNSAIEAAVDRVSLDEHALAKSAKDVGSAAVLVSLLICGLVWGLCLWDRFA